MEPNGCVERLRDMRRLTALALIALATAGCIGSSSAGSSQPTRVHATGVIFTVGGPSPGSPTPIPGAEFDLVGSTETASVRAATDGRFAADLAPGTYRVVVTGHAPRWNGGWLPTTPSTVRIGTNMPKSIRLAVSIK
jgi:hypothetical protein